MPQLTCDEWPADGEPTTTEQQYPVSSPDTVARRGWSARMDDVRAARLARRGTRRLMPARQGAPRRARSPQSPIALGIQSHAS
jgi:hypothetical protein